MKSIKVTLSISYTITKKDLIENNYDLSDIKRIMSNEDEFKDIADEIACRYHDDGKYFFDGMQHKFEIIN